MAYSRKIIGKNRNLKKRSRKGGMTPNKMIENTIAHLPSPSQASPVLYISCQLNEIAIAKIKYLQKDYNITDDNCYYVACEHNNEPIKKFNKFSDIGDTLQGDNIPKWNIIKPSTGPGEKVKMAEYWKLSTKNMQLNKSLWPSLIFDPTPIYLDKHNEKHRRVFIPGCYNDINSPLIKFSMFETFIGPLNKLFFNGLVNTEENENDKKIGYNPTSELSDKLKIYDDEEKEVMKIELLKLWYDLAKKRIEKGGEDYNIEEYKRLNNIFNDNHDEETINNLLLKFFSEWFVSTNTNKIFCATTLEKEKLIQNINSNKDQYFRYITKDKKNYLIELKKKTS